MPFWLKTIRHKQLWTFRLSRPWVANRRATRAAACAEGPCSLSSFPPPPSQVPPLPPTLPPRTA
ncbi:hypothetical protein KGM_215696 [Danaus plexippus plexippus]|uniref:Uncharacterized protein n=1 Tax=Danaus plexippus plexippus TaxID=278856 RepID=A0A212EGT2_DANPL|nr:hypothetical protein KGM_215696 [Danaus plexippus plexippus]